MLRLALISLLLVGCGASRSPELRVVGVNNIAPAHEVVFVQVTNPASRPMRISKLSYVFAAGATTLSEGEVTFEREVPAGQAIVVEVPMDQDGAIRPTTLRGKLTARLDEIVHTFSVSADIR